MHTVIGGGWSHSPDKKYKISAEAHGASGKAFSALTKKRVNLWIGPSDTNSPAPWFAKQYVLVASSLGWRFDWHGSDEVAVHFFDYGDGISKYTVPKGSPSNHVTSLLFRKSERGDFVEVK